MESIPFGCVISRTRLDISPLLSADPQTVGREIPRVDGEG